MENCGELPTTFVRVYARNLQQFAMECASVSQNGDGVRFIYQSCQF